MDIEKLNEAIRTIKSVCQTIPHCDLEDYPRYWKEIKDGKAD